METKRLWYNPGCVGRASYLHVGFNQFVFGWERGRIGVIRTIQALSLYLSFCLTAAHGCLLPLVASECRDVLVSHNYTSRFIDLCVCARVCVWLHSCSIIKVQYLWHGGCIFHIVLAFDIGLESLLRAFLCTCAMSGIMESQHWPIKIGIVKRGISRSQEEPFRLGGTFTAGL